MVEDDYIYEDFDCERCGREILPDEARWYTILISLSELADDTVDSFDVIATCTECQGLPGEEA